MAAVLKSSHLRDMAGGWGSRRGRGSSDTDLKTGNCGMPREVLTSGIARNLKCLEERATVSRAEVTVE